MSPARKYAYRCCTCMCNCMCMGLHVEQCIHATRRYRCKGCAISSLGFNPVVSRCLHCHNATICMQSLEFLFRTTRSIEVGIEDDIRSDLEALGFKVSGVGVSHDMWNAMASVSSANVLAVHLRPQRHCAACIMIIMMQRCLSFGPTCSAAFSTNHYPSLSACTLMLMQRRGARAAALCWGPLPLVPKLCCCTTVHAN